MRIGEPARKHGIAEPDIWHAIRNATRRIILDDDLTMLIGPATNGSVLPSSRSDCSTSTAPIPWSSTPCPYVPSSTDSSIEQVTLMKHTNDEIERAAERFEQLADAVDPDVTTVEKIDDLRDVAVASQAVRSDEAALREAVQIARTHGRSWNQIAVALGVSRQAARQRFADKTAA